MKKVSIIIKALNEETNISVAIKSSLKAIKGLNGEIILSDGLSEDRTIEIAKKYPIKIVQLVDPKDRSCGVGAQIGYLQSNGDYIYILDGDMELDKNFLKKAIKELESDKSLAGVAGIITEMTDKNIVFRRRKNKNLSKISKPRFTKMLMMGGLYKKKAIEKVGYFYIS